MSEPCDGLVVDLHNHSNMSDGRHAPAEVVRKARAAGVDVFGLSDHDSVAGIEEARRAARECGLRLVAGVEISTPDKIHVQGLCVDWEHPRLRALLADQIRKREENNLLIDAKLRELGYPDCLKNTAAMFAQGSVINKFCFAQYLESIGAAKRGAGYNKFFGPEGLVPVASIAWCGVEEAVSVIREAGGIAVLAHLWRYFDPRRAVNTCEVRARKMRALTERFRDAGGEALETAGTSQRGRFALGYPTELALEFGLYASCGTDYHHDGKDPLGTVWTVDPRLVPVWRHPRFRFCA